MFSSSVFREMAKKGRSPLFARLLIETGLAGSFRAAAETVGATFDAAFAVLRQAGLRDEYVYRAAITHNILLGRHSLRTASVLTEFRAGTCKADVVVLNGTSAVYEIKSERDSLARLANQIANYRRVFAKIYVVAGQQHVDDVARNTSSDIGVLGLARWDRISTVREATDRIDLTCPLAIFDALRLSESAAVLKRLQVPIPDVPNTLLHSAMRKCFARLSPVVVHQQMVEVLKQTRSLAPIGDLVRQLPPSLQPAAIAFQIRRADHERVVNAVLTPIDDALAWT